MKRFAGAVVVSVLLMVALFGCGGGGGSSSAPAKQALSGVAATGAAIANGTVTAMDAKGANRTASTDSNGSFTIDVTGLTAPFAIKAEWNDGAPHVLYSFAQTPGTVNLNPMTNSAVIAASGSTDLATFAGNYLNNANLAPLAQVAAKIDKALADIQNKLQPLLVKYSATTTNPFTVNYVVGTPGLDKLFDVISFEVSGSMVTVRNKIDSTVICSGTMADIAAWTIDTKNIPIALGDISITSITPASGTVGDHVIITGTGFIPNPAMNSVKIGNTTVAVFGATATTLEIVIPAGASTGAVTVQNVNGIAQSSGNLTVTNGNSFAYTINQVLVVSGNVVISGETFETGSVIEIKQGAKVFTITDAQIFPGMIQFTAPAGFDAALSATFQVKNGGKVSNVYLLGP